MKFGNAPRKKSQNLFCCFASTVLTCALFSVYFTRLGLTETWTHLGREQSIDSRDSSVLVSRLSRQVDMQIGENQAPTSDQKTPSPKIPTVCHWIFIKYTPSEYELHWSENIKSLQNNVCSESNKQTSEINAWMAETTSDRTAFPESVFSKFTFQNNCTGEIVTDYIEPLAGLTRSPLFCLKGRKFIVQKDYLVISSNVSRKTEVGTSCYIPKSFYFDLGASTYNTGVGGPSQSWFVESYESKGIHWDGIYGWEVTPYSPSGVWRIIPPRLKPIYHWYNIPVNPEPGHPDNALDYIRRVARPEDYVLLKIDIDNTPVEEALIHQLLSSNELLGLVDELFFEHHVNTVPMHPSWRTQNSPQKLEDTYFIFTSLRNKGVMAHSWV
jgi:hypothetical protein